MQPLHLTSDQLDAVFRAAAPLPVAARDDFLKAVAEALAGRAEVGDGDVFRAVREAQKQFWDPPLAAGLGAGHR
jgi:hypothetical protein